MNEAPTFGRTDRFDRDSAQRDAELRASPRVRWQLRTYHLNRTFLLALLGLACGAHLLEMGGGSPGAWILLALTCYVWPQLAWWHSLRSPNLVQAEKRNFLLETAFSGAWAAAFGFPLWLSVVLVVCNSINFVVFHGARAGLPRLAAALGLGAALVWISGLHQPLQPYTGLPTTVLCIVALTSYIVLLSEATYRNTRQLQKSNRMLREQYEEIQALQALLQEQTLHDPLTGLYNQRHLEDVLPPMLERCRAEGKPLALLLVNIDRFKLINDKLGRTAGDTALQALARLLLRHTHPPEMAFRYGGDEFLLVLPEVTQDTALQRAEALHLACTESQIHLTPPGQEGITLSPSLSCGVAVFPGHAANAKNLIACASQALHIAQQQGRNRAVAYVP